MKVIIGVPVYKEKPNQFEIISLQQLNQVLHKYTLAFITFETLNLSAYFDLVNDFKNILVKTFPKRYFESPQTYNKLLKSQRFFVAFKNYNFLLMHHTDAYVFKDELEYWCNQNYDYIGAPIYEYNGTIHPPDKNYICNGNGGFSLHNVQAALKVLASFKVVYPLKETWRWYQKYNYRGKLFYAPYFLRMMSGLGGNAHHRLNYNRVNEDIFWGKYVPEAFDWYQAAPFEAAYKFSMEYNCEKLFALNNNKLPFGCHQWFKHDFLDFWQDKIEFLGYKINN